MLNEDLDIPELFKVLINSEEQYSFWPSFRKDVPFGWQETGVEGSKEECAAYVRQVWLDMTPLSLRKKDKLHT